MSECSHPKAPDALDLLKHIISSIHADLAVLVCLQQPHRDHKSLTPPLAAADVSTTIHQCPYNRECSFQCQGYLGPTHQASRLGDFIHQELTQLRPPSVHPSISSQERQPCPNCGVGVSSRWRMPEWPRTLLGFLLHQAKHLATQAASSCVHSRLGEEAGQEFNCSKASDAIHSYLPAQRLHLALNTLTPSWS